MKIRFKLISFSSQNPSYPAVNLVTNSGHWQSDRFCTYPQQITLEFNETVIINRIKIAVHPSKVPQKINLLYHLPTAQNQHEYTKIGYIVFSVPKQQQALNSSQKKKVLKQLKVIKNISLKAQYLRLMLQQNYKSKNNVFNQVAISSILIQGQSNQFSLAEVRLKNDSITLLDQFAQSKIQLLNQFKQKCISKEQYQEAKQIKSTINQVQILIQEIHILNQSKVKCIHEEDYVQAQSIKESINSIISQIQHIANNFYNPKTNTINKFSMHLQKKRLPNQHQVLQNSFDNQFIKQQQQTQEWHYPSTNFVQNQKQPTYSLNIKPLEHDNKVVPALFNKLSNSGPKEEFQQLAESKITQTLPDQPQQLTPSNEANSSVLGEFYQKLTIKKLYSKHWQFKIQALEQIKQDSKTKQNSLISKNQIRAYIFVFNKIMEKQNNKLFISNAIQLINSVSGMKTQDKDIKIQMSRELEKALLLTLDKMQDNQNQKIKMQAEKSILRMQQSQIFGFSMIFHTITKAYDEKLNSKLKKIYLDILALIISDIDISKTQISPNIVDFTVKKLNDANNQVRKSALKVLKQLKVKGFQDKIRISIAQQQLKQSILKQLN